MWLLWETPGTLKGAGCERRLDLVDVTACAAFRTVNDLELDRLAFLERKEAVARMAE
jgi:hypothetical protein